MASLRCEARGVFLWTKKTRWRWKTKGTAGNRRGAVCEVTQGQAPCALDYAVWAWGDLGGGEAYCINTSWPGDAMTLMGQTDTGRYIYKYTFTKVSEAPANLIISYNGGNNKIYDGVNFVNHGYYVEGNSTPTEIITTTGIQELRGDRLAQRDDYYDLSGRKVATAEFSSSLPKGIYIRGGKKYVKKW